jgi:hypothetical protein
MNESVASVRGCLLGGALGDAYGGIGERGGLRLSDDTQMTLATCEAIARTGRVDPAASPMLSCMFEKRLRGYRAIGYAPGDMPSNSDEATADIIAKQDVDLDA